MPTCSNGPFRARLHRWKNGCHDDWSHPKGKVKPDEDALTGALREVEEETGHRCAPGPRLPTVHYVVNGRSKQVSYWAAEVTDGHFTPNDEVDRILWLDPAAARDRLTQPRDRELVDEFLTALRHAQGANARTLTPRSPRAPPHRSGPCSGPAGPVRASRNCISPHRTGPVRR
ncbi:NUDIX domain-containing protein [Streptomyces sp. SID5476]|uniref:NUDIX hydrolase n=1 Tax=Streptomyces bottropensis ATCC 25435 TaxID=1054862 RepID=M3F511_9ACTN|nr:NUDIX hydrolase [Streptomyces bottropensis ATCC 25435]MZD17100.1 NUDIX domain-containing protein [Streptomyces sp. SID5476]